MAKIPSVKLNNGREIPVLGFGTYARKANPGDYRKAVETAIDVGYRHIDTASSYNNEKEVGEGILKKIKEGVVTRDDLFVTTKLWNDNHAPEAVVPALKQSLSKLGLTYVDLYLIHWPVSIDAQGKDMAIDYVKTWQGMQQCVDEGLALSIGVSNFNEDQLKRLLETNTTVPVVNQVEISLTCSSQKLVDYCKSHSIVPVAYTPLGLLSEARPEFAGLDTIKTDPKFEAIATKYGKTKAQIALKYLLQRGIVVLPKSFTKSRIEENLNLFDFELTAADMKILEAFNLNHKCVPANPWKQFTNYPF